MIGDNFIGTDLYCKFNNSIVLGVQVSTSILLCEAPPGEGYINVSVSYDTGIFSNTVKFLYIGETK